MENKVAVSYANSLSCSDIVTLLFKTDEAGKIIDAKILSYSAML
jgi:NifU-like protein involved in Fe-S cluster formation